MREKVSQMKAKHFCLIENTSQRAEFLPVEWRSSLKLDGGSSLSTVTGFNANESFSVSKLQQFFIKN